MLNFCTLYNSNYAAKGLAMYWSLKRVCPEFRLFVFAFDDMLAEILEKMALPNVMVITLAEFEDEELLRVKPTRSVAEYCWTCTASTILYCLNHYKIDHCTYIDSDLYFYANPQIMLDELGDDDILITPHWFAPNEDISYRVGKYCVQFVTVKNTPNAIRIISEWRKDCLNWCYSQYEDGKMGDQMYLDKWPEKYKGVHVSQNRGGGVAPWNMLQYDFIQHNENITCRLKDRGSEYRLVFYHYHACCSTRKGYIRQLYYEPTSYVWESNVWKILFKPYAQKLVEAYKTIHKLNTEVDGLATHELSDIPWLQYVKETYTRCIKRKENIYFWIDQIWHNKLT